jgi:hypothetical protein
MLHMILESPGGATLVNKLDNYGGGFSPLQYAMDMPKETSAEAVAMLLAHGADPNQFDKFQDTCPLVSALITIADTLICETVCRMLLRAGADANARNRSGTIPLIFALTRKHDTRMCELLLDARADPNLVYTSENTFRVTCLHDAACHPIFSFPLVKILLDHGAYPLREEMARADASGKFSCDHTVAIVDEVLRFKYNNASVLWTKEEMMEEEEQFPLLFQWQQKNKASSQHFSYL